MDDDFELKEKSSKNQQEDSETKPEFLNLPPYRLASLEYQNQTFDDILRNQKTAIRQDYIVYRFNFAASCQAISIVLIIFMLINLILYSVNKFGSNPLSGYTYILSCIMFGESGFLLILSGLTIHRRELVVKKRFMRGKYNPNMDNLKFAFAHSFTYLISALCVASLSSFVYFLF
ncbi:MAG: hypothetical protein JXA54_15050 [Candidatus Heimdallarchaeota archaeon]|nr:hypothetical protein [Candidatus Heimdallarchaeota archaeon]